MEGHPMHNVSTPILSLLCQELELEHLLQHFDLCCWSLVFNVSRFIKFWQWHYRYIHQLQTMTVVLLETRKVESTPLELKARIQSSHTTPLEFETRKHRRKILGIVESAPLELETRKVISHRQEQLVTKVESSSIELETRKVRSHLLHRSAPLESRKVSSHSLQQHRSKILSSHILHIRAPLESRKVSSYKQQLTKQVQEKGKWKMLI